MQSKLITAAVTLVVILARLCTASEELAIMAPNTAARYMTTPVTAPITKNIMNVIALVAPVSR